MNAHQEPVEDYLDELLCLLRLPPREARRSLAETEAHLLEAADRYEVQGLARLHAERRAVEDFGPPSQLASGEAAVQHTSGGERLVAAGQSLLILLGLGSLAIGVSGAVAGLFNWVAGPHFVGALPQTYQASVCHYYLAVHPAARGCAQAATWETSQDAVTLRLLAGAAGVLCLAVSFGWRKFDPPRGTLRALDGLTAALATAAFGAAALFAGGQSLDTAVQHGSGGVGWWLSGALVAAIAAIPCAAIALERWRSAILIGGATLPHLGNEGRATF